MKIGAVGHIKVFRITPKSGAGKSFSFQRRDRRRWRIRSAASSLTIHTDSIGSTKKLCEFMEYALHQHRRRNKPPGTRYEIANSIAIVLLYRPRSFLGGGQAGSGRSATPAFFISSR
jgi:hypothetical protein